MNNRKNKLKNKISWLFNFCQTHAWNGAFSFFFWYGALSERLELCFPELCLRFLCFFFSPTPMNNSFRLMNSNLHCSCTRITLCKDIVHCSCIVHGTYNHFIKKNIKMGPAVLFTYLKIILLQYFHFSVFNKISCI